MLEKFEGTPTPPPPEGNEKKLEEVDKFIREVIGVLYKGKKHGITQKELQDVVDSAMEKLLSTKVDKFIEEVIRILYKGKKYGITQKELQDVVDSAMEKLFSIYDVEGGRECFNHKKYEAILNSDKSTSSEKEEKTQGDNTDKEGFKNKTATKEDKQTLSADKSISSKKEDPQVDEFDEIDKILLKRSGLSKTATKKDLSNYLSEQADKVSPRDSGKTVTEKEPDNVEGKSPESMLSQEGKWPNCSVRKCSDVHNVLKRLQRAVSLPEGKTADDPSLKTVGGIMDYGQRLLLNTEFWESVPNPKKEDLRKRLSAAIEESK